VVRFSGGQRVSLSARQALGNQSVSNSPIHQLINSSCHFVISSIEIGPILKIYTRDHLAIEIGPI
jgi:hypothetical protein